MTKIMLVLILLLILFSCDLFNPPVDPPVDVETGTMTDIDSNIYKTVKIGDQWWMAENLKVTHYRDGSAIPKVTDNTAWSELETGAYCNYDNDDDYADSLGCFYNWYAVNDSAGLAPQGWHVASDAEWKELEIYIGMSETEADGDYFRGTDEGTKLKSATSWASGTGSDIYSFSLIATGYRTAWGVSMSIGWSSPLWTSTESDSLVWNRSTSASETRMARIPNEKETGLCVRCVKDE